MCWTVYQSENPDQVDVKDLWRLDAEAFVLSAHAAACSSVSSAV